MPREIEELEDEAEEFEGLDNEEDQGEEDEGREFDEAESFDGDDGQTSEERPGEDKEEDPYDSESELDQQREQDRVSSKKARSSRRYQELANGRRELERQLEAERAETARLKAERQREQAELVRRQSDTEAERLAQMTPEERGEYRVNKIQAELTYNRQMDEFRRADDSDRIEYQSRARTDKLFSRHSDSVEKALADLRKQGHNMSRIALLKYVIGDEMMKQSEKGTQKSTPQKTRKVPKAAGSSRADVSGTQRGRKPTSEREVLRKRLENVEL